MIRSPDGGSAEVLARGAHVVRWRDATGDEVLYLSPRSRFGGDAAVRGGVPVVFPQFADLGPLPKHGFARTAEWERASGGDGGARAVFRLMDSAATRALWDHAFEATLAVELADALEMTFAVRNTGDRPFGFTAALHTYFRVADVRRTVVRGVAGIGYHDKVTGDDAVQSGDLPFTGETDRVYRDAPDELRIADEAGGRTIVLARRGFPDAVVWNPWARKAAEVSDLGEDQFPLFLCVEAAHVAAPVHLAPGERWEASQTIRVER